jgi:hypothetical protein
MGSPVGADRVHVAPTTRSVDGSAERNRAAVDDELGPPPRLGPAGWVRGEPGLRDGLDKDADGVACNESGRDR